MEKFKRLCNKISMFHLVSFAVSFLDATAFNIVVLIVVNVIFNIVVARIGAALIRNKLLVAFAVLVIVVHDWMAINFVVVFVCVVHQLFQFFDFFVSRDAREFPFQLRVRLQSFVEVVPRHKL